MSQNVVCVPLCFPSLSIPIQEATFLAVLRYYNGHQHLTTILPSSALPMKRASLPNNSNKSPKIMSLNNLGPQSKFYMCVCMCIFFCQGMIMSPLGTMVKVGVIWRAERRKRYFIKGTSDCCLRWKRIYFGQTIQWMSTHAVFHGRIELGTEVDGWFSTRDAESRYNSLFRLHLLFNYTSPWFYYSQPGDCTQFLLA